MSAPSRRTRGERCIPARARLPRIYSDSGAIITAPTLRYTLLLLYSVVSMSVGVCTRAAPRHACGGPLRMPMPMLLSHVGEGGPRGLIARLNEMAHV